MSDNNLWLRASLQNINEGLQGQSPEQIKAFAETLSPEAITGLLKTSNALTDFLANQQGANHEQQ